MGTELPTALAVLMDRRTLFKELAMETPVEDRQ
jgi:hypothetical protein